MNEIKAFRKDGNVVVEIPESIFDVKDEAQRDEYFATLIDVIMTSKRSDSEYTDLDELLMHGSMIANYVIEGEGEL